MAKLLTETLRHAEAFEFFYWLGDKRSLSQVARQFKVTPTAAATWSQSFNWTQRVKDRDDKFAAKLRDKADREFIDIKERQLKIMRATQARYAQRLADNPINGATRYEPTAVDATRAAQHELLLTGGPTSRPEITLGAGTVDSLVTAVIAILKRKLPACCPACKTNLDLAPGIAQELLALSQATATAPQTEEGAVAA